MNTEGRYAGPKGDRNASSHACSRGARLGRHRIVQGGGRGIRPFDRSAFIAAQDAGQSIVVFVHAPW